MRPLIVAEPMLRMLNPEIAPESKRDQSVLSAALALAAQRQAEAMAAAR